MGLFTVLVLARIVDYILKCVPERKRAIYNQKFNTCTISEFLQVYLRQLQRH